MEPTKVADFVSNMMKNLMGENNKNGNILLGFKKFDDFTGGLEPGSLITIGGRTAMGKTALAISIVKNVTLGSNPVLYVNLETTDKQFMDKFLSNATGIELHKIRTCMLTDNDWKIFDDEIAKMNNLPLFVDSRATAKIDELCRDISKTVQENGIKLVIIDYLQLLYTNVSAPSDNRYGDLNYYTRRLKSLAKELNIPIILLSQLNRNAENEKREGYYGHRPQLTDLRDSGTICDDSDMVIFLYRPDYYHIYEDEKGNDMRGKAELIVAKNRFGWSGDFLLECNLDTISFNDYEPFKMDK